MKWTWCCFAGMNHWTATMISRHVGNQTIYTTCRTRLTREHIVPQSLLTSKEMKYDLHNIQLCDFKTNTQRSNYRYCICLQNTTTNVYQCDRYEEFFSCSKWTRKKCFSIHEEYKGIVARTCMYMIHRYPSLHSKIMRHVLPRETMLEWNKKYPIQKMEKERAEAIENITGIPNPFIKGNVRFQCQDGNDEIDCWPVCFCRLDGLDGLDGLMETAGNQTKH